MTSLFISVRKPHHPVKSTTIGHWLKRIMGQAGIDTSIFSAHPTRGAATSKAMAAGVSVPEILMAAAPSGLKFGQGVVAQVSNHPSEYN